MCEGVLVQVFWRERERERYFRFRPQGAPSSAFHSLPPVYRRLQSVPEERAVGWLVTFRYSNFPSFSRVLSTTASALWIYLSSRLLPPPQLLRSSLCLVTAPSTPTTGAIPKPETRQLSNVCNLTLSTGGPVIILEHWAGLRAPKWWNGYLFSL